MYELIKVEFTENGVTETVVHWDLFKDELVTMARFPALNEIPAYPLASVTDYLGRVNHYRIDRVTRRKYVLEDPAGCDGELPTAGWVTAIPPLRGAPDVPPPPKPIAPSNHIWTPHSRVKWAEITWALVWFALGLIVGSTATQAKADDLLLGQVTHHFHDHLNWEECAPRGRYTCEEYNDNQELIGYATDKYAFVYMRQNSMFEESVVITRVFKYDLNLYLRPYVAAGLGSGYARLPQKNYKGITGVGYLGLDIHPANDRVGLLITWLPEGFIGAGLRVKL